jgi:pyruvate/2-oxoglutarate dehydrogenase complex dihydrolipoamide dehydrogenase (E3) component
VSQYEYDIAVIGGGAAGLTASGIAANFGAKTVMIEAKHLGGDCTWYGCIPSKTLIKAAKVVHQTRNAAKYGLRNSEPSFDFAEVMQYVRKIRAEVYQEADAPEIYERMGITVLNGYARFIDPHTLEIATENASVRTITARYIVIAAGSRAAVPEIPGIGDIAPLTNETIFEQNKLPQHLVVVGGGPVGMEMAQTFRRLGAEVTVFHAGSHILPKDDPELTEILRQEIEKDGVNILLNARVEQFERTSEGLAQVSARQNGELVTVAADAVLIASGRRANIAGLNLNAAGVQSTDNGVTVDDYCRTNVRHIYAVGDVTGRYQFTHLSEHMAKTAMTNICLRLPTKIDSRHVPWATFTDPEIAHVGASEADLKATGVSYDVLRFPYSKIDRAITDSETVGWIKVLITPGIRSKILGVSIVGAHAGDMIGEWAVAMKNGVSPQQIADTIHPYPTYGLGNRRAADQWYVRQQSLVVVQWVQRLFGFRGPLPTIDPNRIV